MNRSAKFETITESTGTLVIPEAAAMLQTRYALAASEAAGKRVLELGCGAGQGLGLLTRQSTLVVGGDVSVSLLETAHSHYRDRVPLVRLDAQELPFASSSLDVVLLFEAAYYIPDLGKALREINRILANGGKCLIVSANPERPDFIPSPHSVRYHTAYELVREFNNSGFQVSRVQGAFPTNRGGGLFGRVLNAIIIAARKLVVRWHIVPTTLKGRSRLKRLIYPHQLPVPPELDTRFGHREEIYDLAPDGGDRFKVIYVTAVK